MAGDPHTAEQRFLITTMLEAGEPLMRLIDSSRLGVLAWTPIAFFEMGVTGAVCSWARLQKEIESGSRAVNIGVIMREAPAGDPLHALKSFPAMSKKQIPPQFDLTLTCREIAEIHSVSPATAHRWKCLAGVDMRGESRGVRHVNLGLWGMLRKSDWEQGYPHVARLMGVSRQAVHQMRRRLLDEGQDIPKLPRGRPRKTDPDPLLCKSLQRPKD